MAEVLPPTQTNMENSQDSMGSELYPNAQRTSAPAPNPHFSFPSLSPPENLRSSDFPEPEGAPIRPRGHGHRSRPSNISIAPMPAFGFPEASSSETPPILTSEPSPTRSIPIRSGGHRREGSQFIGGDGTKTGPGLMSTSPTKSEGLLPSPPTSGRRRGHAHRRSGAASQHDLSAMLKPRDNSNTMGLLSGSAPNSPADPNRHRSFMPSLDHSASLPTLHAHTEMPTTPKDETPSDTTPSGSAEPSPRKCLRDSSSSTQSTPDSRPRPRVGFSDNVEVIPRPLSTISSQASEDSDSQATVRPSHSVTGSINSVLSFATSSPPSAKKEQHTAEAIRDYYTHSPTASNKKSDISAFLPAFTADRPEEPNSDRPPSAGAGMILKQAKYDAPWKNSALSESLGKPIPLSTARDAHGTPESQDFSTPLASPQFQSDLRRLRGLSGEHDVDLTQRPRSSPEASTEKKPRKVKAWAGSLLSRKPRTKSEEELMEVGTTEYKPTESAGDSPIKSARVPDFAPMDDFDLDDINFDEDTTCVITNPDYEPQVPSSAKSAPAIATIGDSDKDVPGVLDLDAHWAALDVLSHTNESKSGKRRTMHSSGTTGGFTGPGMHYHRRTESAPALTPVVETTSWGRHGGNSQMADVFEEEEEEEAAGKDLKVKQHAPRPSAEERDILGLGVKIVDSDESLASTASQRPIRRRTADIETPLETPAAATNPASPQDFFQTTDVPVEVVDSTDEPRFSVVTKSSDESTITPTGNDANNHSIAANIPTALDFAQTRSTYLDTPTINSSNPSPDPQHTSFDGPRLHTATSSITDKSTWSAPRGNEFAGGHFNSTEDVPSLTSSASTMISGQPQMSPRFPPVSRPSGERSFSFSGVNPRPNRPTSAGGKRSSLVSLTRLMGSNPHGQKSKLSVASFAPEEEAKPEKKKRHRLSKLKFWKSKERLRDTVNE